ncbi:MAG: Bug family tripartite tricarboxylate transporter substrate binding protein [Burkholderiales bacterium]
MQHHPAKIVCLALTAMVLWLPSHSNAQSSFPQRPIRLVTALPAGNDAYVRVLAARFSEQMGQSVVVDNRTGGSFVPPVQAVASAAPDGYTLLLYSPVMQIAKQLQPSLPFDPIGEFAAIAKIYEGSGGMLLVRPDSTFKTMQDLIAGAKAAPGKLSYGGQIGGFGHLNMASFLAIAGVQAFHVPYKAPGDEMPPLLRGDIDFSFVATTLAMPQVAGGKFRVLGVTSATRMRSVPNAPTLVEVFKNELLAQENWSGLAAPAKTPGEITARLHAETLKALTDPTMRKVIQAGGNEPAAGGDAPEQFGAFMRREFEKWGEIVRISGAKAN